MVKMLGEVKDPRQAGISDVLSREWLGFAALIDGYTWMLIDFKWRLSKSGLRGVTQGDATNTYELCPS